MQKENPIDIVISWVDGKDPVHKKKMAPFLNNSNQIHDDINGSTRFTSEGEIFFCVASIIKFAPFVNKIFIITDDQNPNLDEFIHLNFPENKIPIQIIDHKTIFKDHKDILPVFNSLSIETFLFKIPELSENFVYFNDDFFLMRPIKYEDWFRYDKPVAYGTWRSVFFDTVLSKIKPKKNGHKPFGFKDSMLNAAKTLNISSSYFCIEHTPLPLKKSIFERYYTENQQTIISNISHKFRSEKQFNPQALFYLIAFKSNQCVQEKTKKFIFIKPERKKMAYVLRKIDEFNKNKKILFGCISSVDLAKVDVRNKLFHWLKTILVIL